MEMAGLLGLLLIATSPLLLPGWLAWPSPSVAFEPRSGILEPLPGTCNCVPVFKLGLSVDNLQLVGVRRLVGSLVLIAPFEYRAVNLPGMLGKTVRSCISSLVSLNYQQHLRSYWQ